MLIYLAGTDLNLSHKNDWKPVIDRHSFVQNMGHTRTRHDETVKPFHFLATSRFNIRSWRGSGASKVAHDSYEPDFRVRGRDVVGLFRFR